MSGGNPFAAFACPSSLPRGSDSSKAEEKAETELDGGIRNYAKRAKASPPAVVCTEQESDGNGLSDIARANKEMHDSFARTNILEYTADSKNKRIFQNFRVACAHYGFPGSFQCGSVWNERGVIRSYSNSTPGKDKVLLGGSEIWYRLKSLEMQGHFERNMRSGQGVRFFRRVPHCIGKVTQKPGCKDMGLFDVAGFMENDAFVRLVEREEPDEDKVVELDGSNESEGAAS
jgi:hypothetical protein